MKRVNWYLVVVLVGLMTLMYLSCDRTSTKAFRIVNINSGNPLIVDVVDWAMVPDPEDPEDTISVGFTKDWIVPVEVSYIETGIGLPTYPTTYTARITDYIVKFKLLNDTATLILNQVNGNTNILVPSDPEGQKTVKANLNLIPKEWINQYVAPYLELEESIPGAMLKATVILSGYEELTRDPITDTSYFTVDIGDYYDDPMVVGQ
jgi:hypothetical protein